MTTPTLTLTAAETGRDKTGMHWHGHVLPERSERVQTAAEREERRPDAVLSSAREVADWVELELRRLLADATERPGRRSSGEVSEDWSDSRTVWVEQARNGLRTGAAGMSVVVDPVNVGSRRKCPCRTLERAGTGG